MNDRMHISEYVLHLGVGVSLVTALVLSVRYNYLLFHSLAELFSAIVACGIFMMAWNSRNIINNNYLLFLGIAYLFVAVLDLAHMLGYDGMNVFIDYGPNLPTQLWIAARYVEALSLLVAAVFITRKLHVIPVVLGYSFGVLLLLTLIFGGAFPECFREGSGLTSFKITSEYLICVLLLAAAFGLYRKRIHVNEKVWRLALASILLTVLGELAFTLYVDVYGYMNMLGHVLKILSFYLLYKALIERGLKMPYELLFQDLQASESRFKAFLQYNPAIAYIKDAKGRLSYINPAFEETFGIHGINEYTEDDEEFQTFDVTGHVSKEAEAMWELERPVVVEARLDLQDGKHEWLLYKFPFRDRQGRLYLAGMGFDISERKHAERILHQEKERARQYLDIAGSIIIMLNADQTIGLANRKVVEILGYGQDELLGKNWIDLMIPPEERELVRQAFDRLMAGEVKEVEYFENAVLNSSGEKRLIAWYNTLVFDENGTIVGILSSGEDITERKRLEAENIQLARFPDENPHPVLRVARDGSILYANKSSLPLLQFWDCQIESQPQPQQHFHVIGRGIPHDLLDPLTAIFHSGSTREVETVCEDRVFSFVCTPIVEAGYLNLYGYDISLRKQHEEGQKREWRMLERFSGRAKTEVTAEILNLKALHKAHSEQFADFTQQYERLLKLALEEQHYTVKHQVSEQLRELAEELGVLHAGPRDAINLHMTALKRKIQEGSLAQQQAYTEVGRTVLLELMGYLLSYYRNYAMWTADSEHDENLEEKN